jgi:hypothetical protein
MKNHLISYHPNTLQNALSQKEKGFSLNFPFIRMLNYISRNPNELGIHNCKPIQSMKRFQIFHVSK